MDKISIRELHRRTGKHIRRAAEVGEIYITDRGKTVAKIVPEEEPPRTPYFAHRKLTPAFRKLMEAGTLRGGTDSTTIISQDRDER